MLVMRKDTRAAGASEDGEMSVLQTNASGELRVVSESTDTPWSCTGIKTADAVIKATPGTLAGVVVTQTDTGGDVDVIIYDSPDSTLTDDIALCRITITSVTALTQGSFGGILGPGVVASKGLWLDVVAGDCQVIVYYK